MSTKMPLEFDLRPRREGFRSPIDVIAKTLRHPLGGNGNGNGEARAVDEPPLRAELFNTSQLERHARSLAGWHLAGGHTEAHARRAQRGPDKLLPRLKSNEAVLRSAYDLLTDAVANGRRITPAGEWILDNYYLIEEQIRTARRHLPKGYSRELPRLLNGPSRGYPRIFDIALELITHVDGRIDAVALNAFVGAYQSVTRLDLGELWAIPIMLRLALVENLRRVAVRVSAARQERERAGHWVERMLETAARDPAGVVLVLAEMIRENPPITHAFVSEFASRVQGQGSTLVFPMAWLEQRLAGQGQTIDQVFQQTSQNQAADQVSIGNTIGSLRFLGSTEWRDFVEAQSVVEQALRADPARVYPAMSFATRDRYRHVIEDIAQHCPSTEEAVARRAIELASHAVAAEVVGQTREAHVGHYLVDKGRPALEAAMAMRPPFVERMRRWAARAPLMIHVGAILLVSAAMAAAVLAWIVPIDMAPWALAAVGLLLAIGLSQPATSLVYFFAARFVRPELLPRMDFSKGIPAEASAVVVVPALLTDSQEIDDLLESLEVNFLANRDANLSFALLSDFRDAATEEMPGDVELLKRAQAGIEALNRKHGGDASTDAQPKVGGSFFLFHRPRRLNPRQGVWMGWERKRGKLEEFNAALRGDIFRFSAVVGPVDRLKGVKYVITLDSDTQLPRESARELVATLAHPLNRPRYDEKSGRVVDGYTILQPRVGVSMPSANRSRYARLFAGEPGIDPYTRAVSDVYQDVFGEGSFIGKGIYDVDAFATAVGGRLPENRILSHDLLEGALARSGLVSDVVLFEDYPASFIADVSRRHRWIRGDWQIMPWLLRRCPITSRPSDGTAGKTRLAGNPISWLSQWKILDNLRRSVASIIVLSLLIAAWFTPGSAIVGTLALVGFHMLPALLAAALALSPGSTEITYRQRMRQVSISLGRQALQQLFWLACLPFEAWISLDAIVRTAGRMLFTRRNLLEWRTARDAQRTSSADAASFYRSMGAAVAVGAGVGLGLAVFRPPGLVAAAPVIALWLASPAAAWWLSRPIIPAPSRLAPEDFAFLRMIARKTWRYFEDFVGPLDNNLPPDNFQEDPPCGVAHRTSPTNMGLALLANLAAHDFGFITLGNLVGRTTATLASMDNLRRHRGHFFNWYDTRTLEVLQPLYISTVDSGNLAGHLLTLAAGFEELPRVRPAPGTAAAGLGATLEALGDVEDRRAAPVSPEFNARVDRLRNDLRTPTRTLAGSRELLQHVQSRVHELRTAAESRSGGELKWWAGALDEQCRLLMEEMDQLTPWAAVMATAKEAWWQGDATRIRQRVALTGTLGRLDDIPTLSETARMEQEAIPAIDAALAAIGPEKGDAELRTWLLSLRDAVARGSAHAAHRIREMRLLAARCREMAEMDYDFLYDPNQHLLTTGFNVGDHRSDAGSYDLLSSEARLATFVAIAQGKLPQNAWFYMGRQLTTIGGRAALLSWSGSMFEYLMPALVMPSHPHTLLDETSHAVVARQIAYGHECGVPWGISESGYSATNGERNYLYRAFGVPGLGFKRGLADDLVVAPYATALALMVDPDAACANLRRLADDGRLGAYGLYEAVDYTPTRMPPGESSVTVRSFMVHHQGMSLLALASSLLDKPMQRRFMTDPAFQATALLLQERVPETRSIQPRRSDVAESRGTAAEAEPTYRFFNSPQTPNPEVHLLSNGRYHVAVTAAGGGYSRWRDLAVTRWNEDATRDCTGAFCYLRDVESGHAWSVAYQPTLRRAESYEAIFSEGRAEFRRRDGDIETHVEISVSPEDDVELRGISLTNHGRTRRTIELTTYAEVVLASAASDAAHPAFSKLFVQTELLKPRRAILCTRRPRSAGEQPPWLLHLMSVHGKTVGETSYETDRSRFIGRGGSTTYPAAMRRAKLGDSQGAVLDPIVAIRNTVVVMPDETVKVHVVTGATATREAALELVEKYSDRSLAERVFGLAWTQSQVLLRQLDATDSEALLYGRLAGSLLYANPHLRAPASVIARNRRGQSGLWGYGISGDLPIALLRVSESSQIGLVRQMAKAHAYWRMKGLAADLIIWNEDLSGYRQELQEQIVGAISVGPGSNLLDKPGGVFVRRADQMSEEDKTLMQAVARVVITGAGGSLGEQLDRRVATPLPVPRLAPVVSRRATLPVAAEVQPRDLAMFNGLGGFTQDGREYVIVTTPESVTPAPWVNVLANPWFGTVVSESGGAYTWCENAHSYRLTPWNNDPVQDAVGEAFYVRDEESGRYWSPSPLPARGPMPYTTRHGFGYTVFEYNDNGIATEMTTYVAMDAPVKFVVIRVRNTSGRPRRLSLTAHFELVLGEHRYSSAPHVVTEIDPRTGAVLARNPYNGDMAERVAFLDASESDRTVSGDRGEILGRNGRPTRPACMTRTRLSGRVGAGLDPCAAMQVTLDLPEHQEREVAFIFGSGRDLADAQSLIARFRGTGPARAALEGVWEHWNRTLGAVNVETPDASLNFLANGWLLYQVLSCRIWARSGFYQSGGAFGFRDQLQDAMALVHAQPELLREQLLRAAGRQFPEGDVQHWWHPPQGRGVRTRISDDYLWLPFAACRYVAALGDTGVLDEKIPFLEARPLNADQESSYDLPTTSETSVTLYEHCVRAIRHGLRFGVHGLPLMGSGDWNDGMNLVGIHGKGESVWLAFFLSDVMTKFALLAKTRHDDEFAELCTREAATLRKNIEEHAWDGEWYRRAYFDDGKPLGSSTNTECQIDSLPQSWSVLAGGGDAARSRMALNALDRRLVRRDLALIQLFDPPFDKSDLDPGYVKGYVPGVRENGGQYTHAAVWAAMAFAAVGDRKRAWELFDLINPTRHGDTKAAVDVYAVEPYVVAADVYTNPQHAGRGGWTWYTGSAGWMYRLITESLLGLRLEGDALRFAPCVPPAWPEFKIHYRHRETVYHIVFHNGGGGGAVTRVAVDGQEQPDQAVHLVDDHQPHDVLVELA
ncbi:MAG: cyclic beta 1-2 glucan synthetase [Planctomycetota bacterium]|nr:cyclic beta 1-2 glucan synthetase [Planctomycetota bacterium]